MAPAQTADYIDTGSWADKAIKEAKKVGTVNVAGSTKADNYTRIPAQDELKLTPGAAYVHITTNNTIEGTQWKTLPDVGDAPLVADTSSDIFSGPIDVGALRPDLRRRAEEPRAVRRHAGDRPRGPARPRSPTALPTMLNYKVHAENNSLYNTPPTFGIYMLGLTMKWLKSLGGLAGDRRASTSARRRSSTPRSTAPASIAARRRRTAAR